MKVLITGVAGFIGFHCARKLASEGHEIVGVDNLNEYYTSKLKLARLEHLRPLPNFEFIKLDLADRIGIATLFTKHQFNAVIHLGAQAGVRYSIDNPFAYIDSNIVGMLTILEGCRNAKVDHLIFASSSSVYGANSKQPFSTLDRVDTPISLYAATKRADELISHSYSHLYGIPITALRFFTVYGPWGRPDMAYYKFANAIINERPIDVYNHGNMSRDFTYIDDVICGIHQILNIGPTSRNGLPPFGIYNIGNNQPVQLTSMIDILEEALGKKAIRRYLPMQPGDVPSTYADIADTHRDYSFIPSTPLSVGLNLFANWFLQNQQYSS